MRNFRQLAIIGLAAAMILTLFAGGAVAQDGGRRPGGRTWDPAQMFERMDANKDGQVSKEEFTSGLTRPERGERGERAERPEGRQEGPGGFDPAAMTERMLEQTRENLGSSDEEWTAIKPLVSNLLETRMKTRMEIFQRGRRGGDAPAQSPEVEALQKSLENKEASADDIKQKLTALRDLRKKNEEALQKSRENLRKVLTARQEAALVLQGLLD